MEQEYIFKQNTKYQNLCRIIIVGCENSIENGYALIKVKYRIA